MKYRDPNARPPRTSLLLARIAAMLDVTPAAFTEPRSPPAATGPSPAECEEALILFRRIAAPARREAALKLLRAMASDQ